MQETMTSAMLRQTNRRRIYRYIYEHSGAVTKQDVARDLGLSMPTVNTNLTEFIAEGLLSYTGTLASTGGRKPRVISLVPNARFSVGLSIADNSVQFAAIDLKASELAYQKIYVTYAHSSEYYMRVAQELEHFLDENGLDREKMLGLGVTVPGVVDSEQKMLVLAPTLNLRKVPLQSIRKYFSDYPVCFENDASASGYAESWVHKGTGNLVYLSVGRGVGGALLLNDTKYLGDNGRSGEFGHICIVPNGRQCRCGRKGCLEAYCSTSRLSDDLDISLEDFFRMLAQGNDQIALTWKRYRGYLTDGLSMIRTALDCDIVLGGALAEYVEEELTSIWQEVRNKTLFDETGDFITLDYFKANGACVGAALRYVDQFLSSF